MHFLKSILYERTISTAFNNNEPRLIYKGVPQGGILSPLLYTLYVTDITQHINKNVQISQFADDLALYYINVDIRRSKNLIATSINIVKNNLLMLGLDLCENKSVLMHFNKR